MRFVNTALLAGLLTTSAHSRSLKDGCPTAIQTGRSKAIYFNSNNHSNEVIAVSVGYDGKLSGGTSTPTGGKGAVAIDGSTNAPALKDGLLSQSSLSIAGNMLFTVNPGSNTVSMFTIDKTDPTKLNMVGKPVAVPGHFPNTIAASEKNQLVCVGMTGAVAGVSCATFDAHTGIGRMDNLRVFDINQSTAPVGPTNTVSQVLWSNDQSKLFTIVKGDPSKNNTGFFSSFAVTRNSEYAPVVSSTEIRSVVHNTSVLFGSLLIPNTQNIFATDASFGAAIFSVDSKGQGSLVASEQISGQDATCWVTISPVTKSAFVTDVGTPRLVEMSLTDAKILGQIDLTSTGSGGLLDLQTSGDFLYVLSPGINGKNTIVLVVDIKGGSKEAKVVQQFDVSSLGASGISQGMVLFE